MRYFVVASALALVCVGARAAADNYTLTCRHEPFLLLSSARSGTTWITSQLNGFRGVASFNEPLLDFYHRKAALTGKHSWPAFERRLAECWCGDGACPKPAEFGDFDSGAFVFGFKLMLSEVPDAFFARLVALLCRVGVRVIHLTRRNFVRRYTSLELSFREVRLTHDHMASFHRFGNASTTMHREPIFINVDRAWRDYQQWLVNNRRFSAALRNASACHSSFGYTNLFYEDMAASATDYNATQWRHVCRFLSISCRRRSTTDHFTTEALHAQTPCRALIANFDEVARVFGNESFFATC